MLLKQKINLNRWLSVSSFDSEDLLAWTAYSEKDDRAYVKRHYDVWLVQADDGTCCKRGRSGE